MPHEYKTKRETNYFVVFFFPNFLIYDRYGNSVKYNLEEKISYWKLSHNCQYSY